MIRLPYLSGRVQITSPYGARVLNGVSEFHSGLDLVGLDCKQIVSPVNGVCVRSRIVTDKSNLTWQWGNYVCICGEDGMYYYMCHMSQRCVEEGQMVRSGDLIGIEGNTGYSFGSHCHFEVRTSSGSGAFNPCGLLSVENYAGFTSAVESVHEDTYETIAVANGCHDWSKESIIRMMERKILLGDNGNDLRLNDNITREEAVVLIDRAIEYICNDDGK